LAQFVKFATADRSAAKIPADAKVSIDTSARGAWTMNFPFVFAVIGVAGADLDGRPSVCRPSDAVTRADGRYTGQVWYHATPGTGNLAAPFAPSLTQGCSTGVLVFFSFMRP